MADKPPFIPHIPNLAPEHLATLQRLARENEALRAKVMAMEAEKSRQAIEPGKESELPQLLPRPEFIREVARMVAHDKRYGARSAMISLSFEGLDAAKDALGPYAYDAVLRSIAETLVSRVRACDIVGRTGTEDFSVFLTRCNEADAERKAAFLVEFLQEKLDPLLKDKVSVALRYCIKPVSAP